MVKKMFPDVSLGSRHMQWKYSSYYNGDYFSMVHVYTVFLRRMFALYYCLISHPGTLHLVFFNFESLLLSS
jgi:hypothetical protein